MAAVGAVQAAWRATWGERYTCITCSHELCGAGTATEHWRGCSAWAHKCWA